MHVISKSIKDLDDILKSVCLNGLINGEDRREPMTNPNKLPDQPAPYLRALGLPRAAVFTPLSARGDKADV